MKTRITLLIASVALVTLSFTFVGGQNDARKMQEHPKSTVVTPIGGILADEVVR